MNIMETFWHEKVENFMIFFLEVIILNFFCFTILWSILNLSKSYIKL